MSKVSFSVQGEFVTKLARERFYYEHNLEYALELLKGCTMTDRLSEAEHLKLCVDILEGRKEIRGIYPSDDYGVFDAEPTARTPGILAAWKKREDALKDLERKFNLMVQKFIFVAEELDDWDIRQLNEKWHEHMYDPHDPDRETAMPAWLFPDHESANENHGALWGTLGSLFSDSDDGSDCVTPANLAGTHMLADYMKAQRVNLGDDYGWLSPTGEWFPVEWGEHENWAMDYIVEHAAEFGFSGDEHEVRRAVLDARCDDDLNKLMHEKGWILLHSPHMGIARTSLNPAQRVTKPQREFLFNYYSDRGLHSMAEEYLDE